MFFVSNTAYLFAKGRQLLFVVLMSVIHRIFFLKVLVAKNGAVFVCFASKALLCCSLFVLGCCFVSSIRVCGRMGKAKDSRPKGSKSKKPTQQSTTKKKSAKANTIGWIFCFFCNMIEPKQLSIMSFSSLQNPP